MTETDIDDSYAAYERRVKAIKSANQPILEGFEKWLKQSGPSEQTIKNHVDNIQFFSHYLLYYEHNLRSYAEATEGDVYDFLEDWFPRKAMWASVSSTKAYIASFKKFFNLGGRNWPCLSHQG